MVAIACTASLAGVVSQAGPPDEKPPVLDRSASIVEVVSHDAEDKGSVPMNQPVSRRIVVRNISVSPIRIIVHAKSCGCLNPTMTPELVQPGETSTLVFGVAAAVTPNQQKYTVAFRAVEEIEGASSHRTQDVIAGLRYTTDAQYLIRPSRLYLEVTQGEPIQAALFLQSLAEEGLRPREVTSTIAALSVAPDRAPVHEGINSVWPLRISGRPESPGLHHGIVRLVMEGAKNAEVDVPIVLRVLPRWRASPPGVVADLQHAGQTITRRVSLTDSRSGGGLAGVRQTGLSAGISAKLEAAAEGTYGLVVSIDARAVSGPATDSLEVFDQNGRVVGVVPVVLYKATTQP